MPLTIIVLKKVPNRLRGDLTKWMQEISTGVYVGNFNSRIREKLWIRVKENLDNGQATMAYATNNEIGYNFETNSSEILMKDYEGIPLVFIPNQEEKQEIKTKKYGYSDASKNRNSRKYGSKTKRVHVDSNFVVIDIETDGLDVNKNEIIEIAAMKIIEEKKERFQSLVKYEKTLPKEIEKLTGISQDMLESEEARDLEEILIELKKFIEDYDIVGYGVNFDIRFLNKALKKYDIDPITNRYFDLIKYVKKEKIFQGNYKLQTSLSSYGIEKKVTHRALEDVELIYELAGKVNGFLKNKK